MRQDTSATATPNGGHPGRERQESENRLLNGTQTVPSHAPPAPPTLEIANQMVRTYKAVLGRGPTKARALFAGPDALVVVLEDTMTVQERNLAALGEEERLREQRLFLTSAAEDELRSVVERVLGRRTVAFVSGFDIRRDIAMEILTLEPEPTNDVAEKTNG